MAAIVSNVAVTTATDVSHLNYRQKTNLGSFYTPPHIVRRVYDMLDRNGCLGSVETLLEPACGYGAFFSPILSQTHLRLIGADIDADAISVARQQYPNVALFAVNGLSQVSREKYRIGSHERLLIVGNPPYNDVTSHVKNSVKATPCDIDSDVRSRDLGLSFMLAAAKLNPDYIAILHPLSYLIKETNFKVLHPFMRKYCLRDAIVFSSQEFTDTSKGCGFPIVATVYERSISGTHYAEIRQRRFNTIEGTSFSISDYDYISRYITKYPTKVSFNRCDRRSIKFFTMRDINALKRSRTFIQEDTANTIYIIPEKLPYYCYVDTFKDIAAKLPYYFGNLDIMLNHNEFLSLKNDFVALSVAKHPLIFSSHFPIPEAISLQSSQLRIQHYFKRLFRDISLCI